MGMKMAQVALSYGADDIDGTVVEEKIYHMAGAKTPQEAARAELIKAIRETGREPIQRDSLYNQIEDPTRTEARTGGPSPQPSPAHNAGEGEAIATLAGANSE